MHRYCVSDASGDIMDIIFNTVVGGLVYTTIEYLLSALVVLFDHIARLL